MIRRSPQTERLVEVVEFLSHHPHEAFRLADLARLLGTDKATCYPMLVELTHSGWLVKDPAAKTYRLGPRLIGIGASAAAATSVADCARTRLQHLADEFDSATCLVVRSGQDLVVADRIRLRTPCDARFDLEPGDHIEFRPPLGSVLVAWDGPYAVETWLRRAGPRADTTAAYHLRLKAVRSRHFAVEVVAVTTSTAGDPIGLPEVPLYGARRTQAIAASRRDALRPGTLLAEIDEAQYYETLSVNAAVFDDTGAAVGAVAIVDFPDMLSGSQVRDIGEKVVDAAERITVDLGGRMPWHAYQQRSVRSRR